VCVCVCVCVCVYRINPIPPGPQLLENERLRRLAVEDVVESPPQKGIRHFAMKWSTSAHRQFPYEIEHTCSKTDACDALPSNTWSNSHTRGPPCRATTAAASPRNARTPSLSTRSESGALMPAGGGRRRHNTLICKMLKKRKKNVIPRYKKGFVYGPRPRYRNGERVEH